MDRKHILQSGIYNPTDLADEAERRINYLKKIGYLDFLAQVGYTPLVFTDGRLIFFPVSALPPGVEEGDKIELTVRRIKQDE
jgi:hypothetical protein